MVLTALAIITAAVVRELHVLQLAVVVAGRRGLVGRRSAWPRNRLCRDLRGDRAGRHSNQLHAVTSDADCSRQWGGGGRGATGAVRDRE